MNVNTMNPNSSRRHGAPRHSFSEDVVDSTSDPVYLHQTGRSIAVAVVPEGTASVEFSISAEEYVADGTATWFKWELGDVSEETVVAFLPSVTALRLVSAGRTNWEIST